MIRLLIVDGARLICTVMAAVFQDEPDIEVVDYATTIEEALNRLEGCDVALVCTTLPGDGALELTWAIAKTDPSVKVLVMGLPESEAAIIEYIEAGAAGYVLNNSSLDELKNNVRATQSGEALVSPQIAAAMMTHVARLAELRQPEELETTDSADLTPRELEVLALVGHGFSNQEIANQLIIELGTVKNHIHNILRKLNVSSRWDAVTYLSAVTE